MKERGRVLPVNHKGWDATSWAFSFIHEARTWERKEGKEIHASNTVNHLHMCVVEAACFLCPLHVCCFCSITNLNGLKM